MYLDTGQVEAFLVVAELLHFGEAAKRLNLSQSSVSHRIRALEDQLGLALFSRTSRSVALTPAGRAFRRRAASGHRELYRAAEDARLASQGWSGRLTIACSGALSATPLPEAVAALRREAEQVSIELQTLAGDEQRIGLEEGTIDLGCAFRAAVFGSELTRREVSAGPLFAWVASDHPAVAAGAFDLRQVEAESMIVLSERAERDFEAYVRAALAGRPKMPIAVDGLEAAMALVRLGAGVLLLPATPVVASGVVRLPVHPAREVVLTLAWRTPVQNPVLERLLALLSQGPGRPAGSAALDREQP